MTDRTGERCDWCHVGTYVLIGINEFYFRGIDERIYKCTECHHEVPSYERSKTR